MNKQPYTIPPRRWEPKLSPSFVRWSRPYRRWRLRAQQKIVDVRVEGREHLQSALTRNGGVLITPNHSAHYDSAALYLAADQVNTPLYFMTAWQVFGMSSAWERHVMQRLGCFSIDRESSDRVAYKRAVEILQAKSVPLVIFPEGDVFHVTDRVTPFREGAAAIAISATRRSPRPIYVVPCAIKFFYVDDPTRRLERLMGQLEQRLLLRPLTGASLTQRIYRFADGLLALKEVDYLGRTQAGTLRDRIAVLTEGILAGLESRYGVRSCAKPVPERVKDLRQRIIQLAEERASASTRRDPGLTDDMEDLFFAMQLYSYPGDYLLDQPSVERLAETLDKFEEDVLQREIPSVHGRRRVTVRFGPPLEVSQTMIGRGDVPALTQRMHAEVQALMDGLCGRQPAPVQAAAAALST